MKKIVFILGIMLFTASLAFGAALNEGFETWPPTDWTIVQGSASPTNDITQTSDEAYSGTYSARFSSFTFAPTYDEYMITPQLVTTGGDQTISFWYIRSDDWQTEVFKVGWSSTGSDVSTDFTWSAEISDASTTWQQYSKTDLPIGTKYVAIHYYSDYMYYLYVDDVAGPDLYVPAYPKPTDLTTSSITQTTASLDWTNGGAESSWDVEYGASGYTQGTGTTISGILSHPYTLNPPLTANTTYDWYVRADYGSGNYSDWAGAETFTTPCAPVTTYPYTEAFEATVPPDCWSEVRTPASSYGWASFATGYTGKCARFDSYLNGDDNISELITNTLDLSLLSSARLKFVFKNPTGGDFSVLLSTDGGSTYPNTIWSGLIGQTDWLEKTADISAYIGSDVKIAFKGTSNYGNGDAYVYLDDVTVEEIPTSPIFSIDPALKDFGTVNIGSSSAAQTFTISNTGVGTLTITTGGISITGTDAVQFGLTDGNSYPINLTAGQSTTVDVTFSPTSVGAKTANLHIVDNIAKTEHDIPLSGDGWNDNHGGGGAAQGGYFFANSTTGASGAPSQPSYSWIDISTTGTDVIGTVSGDNSVGGPYEIGFTFNYFGVDYTQFWICADGYIDLVEETSSEMTNAQIPSSGEPNCIIALLWDDMNPGDPSVTGYHLYYGASGGNMVISYVRMPEYGATTEEDQFTAQAILYPSGNIKMQYKEVGSSFDLTSCTVGIENAAGDAGVQYLYNTTGGPIFAGAKADEIAVMFGTDEGTLPVEILAGSFNAVYTSNELGMEYVTVNWSTVTETDVNGFNIYRSYENDITTAGNHINTSLIPGHGTTTEIHDYAFEDITADVYSTYYYWLEVVEIDGQQNFHGPINNIPKGENPDPQQILTTKLLHNSPNPVNNTTTIKYQLKGSVDEQNATICIYNILGALVRKVNGEDGKAVLDVSELPTGIYFYKLETDTYHSVKKMVIIR